MAEAMDLLVDLGIDSDWLKDAPGFLAKYTHKTRMLDPEGASLFARALRRRATGARHVLMVLPHRQATHAMISRRLRPCRTVCR